MLYELMLKVKREGPLLSFHSLERKARIPRRFFQARKGAFFLNLTKNARQPPTMQISPDRNCSKKPQALHKDFARSHRVADAVCTVSFQVTHNLLVCWSVWLMASAGRSRVHAVRVFAENDRSLSFPGLRKVLGSATDAASDRSRKGRRRVTRRTSKNTPKQKAVRNLGNLDFT